MGKRGSKNHPLELIRIKSNDKERIQETIKLQDLLLQKENTITKGIRYKKGYYCSPNFISRFYGKSHFEFIITAGGFFF